ncbi:NLGN2 [Anthophora quadrimaculata]
MGSVHGEDLPFVFGAPLVDGFGHFPRNYTRPEVALSESIVQYFANFVRTGELDGRAIRALPELPLFESTVTWHHLRGINLRTTTDEKWRNVEKGGRRGSHHRKV